MCDGYNAAGEDNHPELEDEFLCEYVDGTMDPIVREVFEEYVRANPELEDHIECLRHTRLLLCRYGCRCHAPRDLHERLRRRITCDLVNGRVPFHVVLADRLKGVATVSSAMAILVVVGFLGGVSAMEGIDRPASMATASVVHLPGVQSSPGSVHVEPETASPSVVRTPRLSPRPAVTAPLQTGRSLVAAGLERELQIETAYAVAAGRFASFP